ncbi:uncharacterized protein TNCV_2775711 [Trichonephila clavipes]|nr:uncharacterized protein TNCV_2775711 [Trichonephila clavipes]
MFWLSGQSDVNMLLYAHGFTCRNCGGGDRGRVAIYRPFGEVSLSLNRTVTCMVLKANDRRTSCPCHDEFRGPRSGYVRQEDPLLFLAPKIFRQKRQIEGFQKGVNDENSWEAHASAGMKWAFRKDENE